MTFGSQGNGTEEQGLSGVPEESVGILLQRGGEELRLRKVRDRATIRLKVVDGDFPAEIPFLSYKSIPQTELIEIKVGAENLETAIAIARRLDSVAFASHVYRMVKNPGTFVYLTDEITLQFTADLDPDERDALLEPFALQRLRPITGIDNAFIYQLTPQSRENPLKIANRLAGTLNILTAEANIIIRQEALYRPKDELYNQQWYLHHNGGRQLAPASHIDAEKAWDITRGVRSVVVAVADDAIDLNHPDFQGEGKIVAPKDFKGEDFLPLPEYPQESHGTACAGVAVAEETGTGVVGVAPGCALMPLRTSGFLDDRSIEALFEWAANKGASVISCSWGAASLNFPLSLRQRAAINRAATKGRDGKGCVVVFAAGNANRPVNGTIYERKWQRNILKGPTKWLSGFAAHPDAIAVSACTSLNQKSAYSNWGKQISVSAPSNNAPPGMWFQETGFVHTAPPISGSLPGLGIFTADRLGRLGYAPGNFTRDFGGTSSACPVVAGVAALVLSVNPDLTAQEVKQILQKSTDKIVDRNLDPQLGMQMGTYDQNGHSQWFGYGKVNAFKAVGLAQKQQQTSQKVSKYIEKSNERSVAIPDNDSRGAISRIEVRESGILKDIQVMVSLEHDFLGDLEVYLKTPTNRTILLQGRTLGARTQVQMTYTPATAPILKQILNLSARGTWTLWAVDRAVSDTGKIQRWALRLGV
ncbi:S8 family serine peptidase [Lusitaniella coriacea]|uniref:S8 family serine peptidase n=1 Tax=Lusitaniella coriacea TaxID=1983105 RepID=UPI003CFAA020